MQTVAISEMMKEFDLKLLTDGIDITKKTVSQPEINRPGLQFAGFYDYFDPERVQIIGMAEYTYLMRMTGDARESIYNRMFNYSIPCLILCRGLNPLPDLIRFAEQYDIPVLSSQDSTTDFMGEIIRWLKVHLAPRITMHGVLVDIYGEGTLMIGESGIGKSETALELIKRGHRFVADDAVEIKRVSHQTLIGSCPELIKYFIELRGIGIIDVKQMFGVESIKETQSIDLILKLEVWDKNKEYDRFGLTDEYMGILGNNVVCNAIPVRPGRNLAIICESAAINHRQKKMGYNAAQMLNERIMNNINRAE